MTRVALFANKGWDSNDEDRIRALLAPLAPSRWRFDRSSKARAALQILRRMGSERPEIVVMEGTGVAGGAAVMAGRLLFGVPYVVSSGDAVAPFFGLRARALLPLGGLYERLLYRLSSGFIGWTPYLVGRALTLGAPRAMTAEGWAPHVLDSGDRERIRARLGIGDDVVVVGIAGSLTWSRHGYCYGMELVRAIRRCDRGDVAVVVLGDGDGRSQVEAAAGDDLGRRAFVPGAVPQSEVPAWLAAFDIASLPQSVDGVGAFRYTTKLSEYVDARLPVVTGHLPFAYDLDGGWIWRLPGSAPWDDEYIQGLARFMNGITREEVAARRDAVPRSWSVFDRESQTRRVTAFIEDILR